MALPEQAARHPAACAGPALRTAPDAAAEWSRGAGGGGDRGGRGPEASAPPGTTIPFVPTSEWTIHRPGPDHSAVAAVCVDSHPAGRGWRQTVRGAVSLGCQQPRAFGGLDSLVPGTLAWGPGLEREQV